jgi:hypothetical protein
MLLLLSTNLYLLLPITKKMRPRFLFYFFCLSPLFTACNAPAPVADAVEVCACIENVKHTKGLFSGGILADSCYEAVYIPLQKNYEKASTKDRSEFKTRVRACIADASISVVGNAFLKALD